ncbi:synaptic vesicle glycoprotein 2A [Lampris incognitus]|uniref:synaptic vesicle glycoprotein 2A n=1 Tax=Lampris incognitus TaxID=2546036 RepID=UPI0024B5BB15|nr:synaptic vesicle glycoprotein 2A [Lampris incognitus]
MDDDGAYRDGRTDFIRGAKDIAKVAKKQVGKKVGRGVDKMSDEYTKRSYKRFEEEDDEDDYAGVPGNDGGYYRNDSRANDDEGGHSDSTEGHDEDDEIYEGEYQGIPRADSGKVGGIDGVTAVQAQQFRDLSAYEAERRKDQEELAEQYETILQECGHGKFQWTLYFVLGLALMADGVEIFVVGFVLPSAEKDMCLSEPNKGMLGKMCKLQLITPHYVPSSLPPFIAFLFSLSLLPPLSSDLFKYRLINSRLINSTFLHNKEGCLLSDISDDNNAYMVYFVSFLGTLAVLPGNIVSALLMDKIGRLRMLAGSSVISCISCFFLSFGNSESAMIALLCLFGGISIASWNALDVLTVELYPSDKRTTAFGFLNALCKLAAVLGISIFTSFVGITKAVPILFASGALAAGSFLALKLPETRGQVLQ